MDQREFLTDKIVPFDPCAVRSVNDALTALGRCSFQGRALAQALDVWERMCRDSECLRVISLAGAMIPAGMGLTVMRLLEARLLDVLVVTGAALSHDLCNIVAADHQAHYLGSEAVDDEVLRVAAINRVYDTFLPEEGFTRAEDAIAELLPRMRLRAVGDEVLLTTTADFCRQLGRLLAGPGLLTAAARAGAVMFVPAISDSELGLTLAARSRGGGEPRPPIVFDALQDISDFADLVRARPRAGLVTVGGGVPRNWAQQVFPYLKYKLRQAAVPADGYHYGVRLTTDRPEFGGLSGCTISESKSWGKYEAGAVETSVIADATIALPLLATALLERLGGGA